MKSSKGSGQSSIVNCSASIDSAETISICTEAISTFFEGIQLPTLTPGRDLDLEVAVRDQLNSWGLGDMLRGHDVTAIVLTVTAYSHLSASTRLQITLYTAIATCMDGRILADPSTFHTFHQRFHTGSTQSNVLLDEFSKLLVGMPEHFSWFAANSIVTSSLEFINVTLLESDSASLVLRKDALPFLDYRRRKSGIAEAFTYFIWEKDNFPDVKTYMQAVPDIMLYIERANDILSFYKEELAGETENYIKDRALVTGKTAQQSLHEVIEEVVAASKRIHETLGEGKARDAWDSFAAGYVCFHIKSPRYRLKEILGSGSEYLMGI